MILSDTKTIREADRRMIQDHHYPGVLLMEEAGKQAASAIMNDCPDQKNFLVLAGPGNNGGDGFVIARILHLAGKQVSVLLSKPETELPDQGDAADIRRILHELPISIQAYKPGAISAFHDQQILMVDALLGTGIQSDIRGSIAQMISEAIESQLPCVAIDLPSGLNADTGASINRVIPAQYTYTFQLPKICHYVSPASFTCGNIRVLDIGIWPSVLNTLDHQVTLLEDSWIQQQWKPRQPGDHKGTMGHALIIAGSKHMAGAAILATKAALRAGAGLVTVACPDTARFPLLSNCPEAMCLPLGDASRSRFLAEDLEEVLQIIPGKTAVLIGPGCGLHQDTQQFIREILANLRKQHPDIPVVVDADALNSIAGQDNNLPPNSILTPHPGEMKRLLRDDKRDIQADRISAIQDCVEQWQATTVLKGAGTLIAGPGTPLYVNPTGNPALAAGGTGDVLAGLITAFAAQGYSPEVSASLGAYLHGKTADLWVETNSPEGLTAAVLADRLPYSFPD